MERIPFNQPFMTGRELHYIAQAHFFRRLSGGGPFTDRCQHWLIERTGTHHALLTHSCTAALELAAITLGIRPGDEVIMPSYTFVSTANAFVLRGGVPVFVDIRPDTLNIDESLVDSAITRKTRAIVPVHYAGVACEMDVLRAVAKNHGVAIVEDAAQAVMAHYKGRALGTLGDMGAYSFHETKNVMSGEGGALLINSPAYMASAEIIREKGTDRSRFFRGEVDKYIWQSIGSSFLPSDITAAFLWAQLEAANELTERRVSLWSEYHRLLAPAEEKGLLRRPVVPDACRHNGHMYYVVLAKGVNRGRVLNQLDERGVHAVFHYVPLHSSPAGQLYARTASRLPITEDLAYRLIRLPLWIGLTSDQQNFVVESLVDAIERYRTQ